MARLMAFFASLRNPMEQIKLLMIIGGVSLVFVIFSSFGGAPKPWESAGPAYLIGEVEDFTRTMPSRPLPKVMLEGPKGPVPLANYADGRVLVVNLWATWCAPCLEELPSLDALQETMGEQARVLAIALEPGDGTAQERMFQRLGIENLTMLRDPKLSLSRAYGGDVTLPITVIYDGRGREIGMLTGSADWHAEESVRLVRAIAGGALPR
ncbi:MAG: TlpA disulfide reductase family protein [Pseudomonadota bacterium]